MAERKVAIARPSLGDEEWQALRAPLESGWLTQGPRVLELEGEFAARHGVRHAVAASSGTAALHLALAAIGIGPGDEVIVPAFTWIATANAVLYCGATPVFVDIDPRTFNIDPSSVAARVTGATRAIVPVHLFGLCADIDAIVAAAPSLAIVEDAACAAGASYKGRTAGSMGVAGAFSLHPRKSITTGEGGFVTTDDDDVAAMVRSLRNHGAAASVPGGTGAPHELVDHEVLGFNYRLTDIQAAMGLPQLRKLDAFIDERRKGAAFYEQELGSIEWLRLPSADEGYGHSWQAYVCWVDEETAPMSRNQIMETLAGRGIATRPGTHAVHMLGLYRERFGLAPDDFPNARDGLARSMAIPLHGLMDADDYAYVAEALLAIR